MPMVVDRGPAGATSVSTGEGVISGSAVSCCGDTAAAGTIGATEAIGLLSVSLVSIPESWAACDCEVCEGGAVDKEKLSTVLLMVAAGEKAAGGGTSTIAGSGISRAASACVVCAIEEVLMVLVIELKELDVLVTVTREELVVLVLVERPVSAAAAAVRALVFFAAALTLELAMLAAVDLGIAVHLFPLIVVKKAPAGRTEDVDILDPASLFPPRPTSYTHANTNRAPSRTRTKKIKDLAPALGDSSRQQAGYREGWQGNVQAKKVGDVRKQSRKWPLGPSKSLKDHEEAMRGLQTRKKRDFPDSRELKRQ